MRQRSAADLVVLGITAIVGALLIITAISVVVLELVDSNNDTADLVRVESEILAVLVGALVGFIGGRATGRAEAKDG